MSTEASRWRVAGTSVAGTSHSRTGQPCQDAHRWKELPGGVLLVAAADGAGSAPLADAGSVCAVQAAVESVADGFQTAPPSVQEDWQQVISKGFHEARRAIVEAAERQSCPARDLATTLLLALASPARVAAGQVGDGAIVARLADGQLQPLTRPATTEY